MANIEKLEATLDHIRMNREQHDQIYWAMKTECGTTMCFAGTAVALAGYELSWIGMESHVGADSIYLTRASTLRRRFRATDSAEFCVAPELGRIEVAVAAEVILELTERQSLALFHEAKTFDDVENTVKDIINAEQAA